jgi:hypothetical protein
MSLKQMLENVKKLAEMPPSIRQAKLAAAVQGNIFGRLYADRNHDIHQSLLVAGTHRSGSTWLANILNHSLHYRFIFEPIRHTRVKSIRRFRRLYIRPGQENPHFKQYFADMLTGAESNYHLNRKNDTFLCHGRLLKDTSVNLHLKWLRQEFPFLPIIQIIRNPFLVVSSCLKVDWLHPYEPDFWLGQEELVEDYLQPFVKLISKSKTDAEKYMLEWCILNFVPLQQFQSNEWKLVFYDSLVHDPGHELKKVFCYLEKSYEESILEKLSLASHTAEEDVKDRRYLLNKWTASLSLKEQAMIEDYAGEFCLEPYLGLNL